MIYRNYGSTIGNTPLVELKKLREVSRTNANLFAKVESFNPAGSIKDRVAKSMIDAAEKKGFLKEGAVIVEPTSGNTGIGLALVARTRGYKIILTMPETMSVERRKMLKAYGAELVLTPGSLGMGGAIEAAKNITASTENAYMPMQFDNPANPAAHYQTTGPEIWKTLREKVDVFVSGVGTGGTITGVGRYLREQNPDIKIIAVEPAGSPVLSGGEPGAHKIQGIGAGFIPKILDRTLYDEIIQVKDADAFEYARKIAKLEGILVGISSGAATYAAVQIANRSEFAHKNIVTIFYDSGERYLSTSLYN